MPGRNDPEARSETNVRNYIAIKKKKINVRIHLVTSRGNKEESESR